MAQLPVDPSVLYVGDFDQVITDKALAVAFGQFGTVLEARVLREPAPSTRSLGCGWLRFADAAKAGKLLKQFNEDSLFSFGGTPRPWLVGRSLGDVLLPAAGGDPLEAAAATVATALQSRGAPPSTAALSVDVTTLLERVRVVLRRQAAERDALLSACWAEHAALHGSQEAIVQAEGDKLQIFDKLFTLYPSLNGGTGYRTGHGGTGGARAEGRKLG